MRNFIWRVQFPLLSYRLITSNVRQDCGRFTVSNGRTNKQFKLQHLSEMRHTVTQDNQYLPNKLFSVLRGGSTTNILSG